MLPRPSGGSGAVRYLVNAAGFEQSTFSLSSESAPHIQLVLPPRVVDAARGGVRVARTGRPDELAPTRRVPAQSGTTPTTTPPTTTPPTTQGASSPLLHPWQ
jgi:hypothetical protein